jgi:hypothetical protein
MTGRWAASSNTGCPVPGQTGKAMMAEQLFGEPNLEHPDILARVDGALADAPRAPCRSVGGHAPRPASSASLSARCWAREYAF